jgi:hypothetical protein
MAKVKKGSLEEKQSYPLSVHFKGMREIGDEPVKDDLWIDETEVQQKKKNLFDIIDDIKVQKTGELLKDEEYKKLFNSYMILHILSMNEDYCEIVNMLNEYQGTLTKEMMYKMLVELIPQGKTYDQYIKTSKEIDDEDVKFVSMYYEVGFKTARDYIKLCGKDWSRDIQKKFGGRA